MILGIANAQFKDSVETSTQKRYALVDYEEDNEYDEASEDDDTNELDLSTEIVGGEYTIDNIAELRKSVASTTSGKIIFRTVQSPTLLTLAKRLACCLGVVMSLIYSVSYRKMRANSSGFLTYRTRLRITLEAKVDQLL